MEALEHVVEGEDVGRTARGVGFEAGGDDIAETSWKRAFLAGALEVAGDVPVAQREPFECVVFEGGVPVSI